MYDGIGVFPRYTAKQTVEQCVRCVPTRPERLVRPQRHYLCPSRVWYRFSKGSSRFDPYGSIASDNHVQAASWDELGELGMEGYLQRFHTRFACRSQAQTCHLVLQVTPFAHKEYRQD